MTGSAPESQRLDRWLFHARLFKSRALAQRFCEAGRVRINRRRTHKAHHPLRPDDVLSFALGARVRVLRVRALGARRGPAEEARRLYDEIATERSDPVASSAHQPRPPS